MRRRLLPIVVILFSLITNAQQESTIPAILPTKSYDGTVEYKKTLQQAKIFEFNYPANELEEAIGIVLGRKGAKVKKEKGFNSAKSIKLHESDEKYYDVYYKIDGKGKGESATSTLYVIVAEPGENIVSRVPAAAGTTSVLPAVVAGVGATAFFSEMGNYVGDHSHGRTVAAYSEEVKKAEKKYNNLMDESKSLAKKKSQVEKDIEENNANIEKQAKEIEKRRELLKQVQSKN